MNNFFKLELVHFLKMPAFKTSVIFLFLLFTFSFCNAQQVNCFPFKEGRFRINDKRAGGVIIAERKGGYQTESMEVLKAVVRFKITWQNDCTYTLSLDKVIRNENKVPFPDDMTVTVKIIASSNNTSYTQEATSSVINGAYRSEVEKIR